MTIEEFLASRKNASEEEKEAIRGLYNVLKDNVAVPDAQSEEFSKMFASRAEYDNVVNSIKDLKDQVEKSAKSERKEEEDPLREAMRAMFDASKKGERNGVEFEPVSVRAAAVMTMANALTQAPDFVNTTIDKQIHSAREPRLGVVARLNRGASRTAVTRYTSLAGTEGGAAITAEGALKPLYSTSYTNNEAVAKKIAIRLKVTEEFEDFTEFYADLVTRANRNLASSLENEVVNGAGGADHLAGIVSIAPAFNVPALASSVQSPDLVDVILAMATQARALNFNPNVAFVNYIDYSKLMFLKDTTNRPMSAEDIARLGGITLIPVSDTAIATGHVLVMDDSVWNLFVNNVTVREGYGVQKVGTEVLSDLDVNMRTVIFETFVKSYCPAVELHGVVYDAIATVQTAIAKA